MNSPEHDLALRNLMARYVDAVNRGDGDAWITTWAEDASWQLLGNTVTGRDSILALWQQMMTGFEFALMLPSSCLFDINGHQASGHWYLQEHTRDREGNAARAVSRYRDNYSCIDGEWLYQSRDYDINYYGPADLSGNYTPLT